MAETDLIGLGGTYTNETDTVDLIGLDGVYVNETYTTAVTVEFRRTLSPLGTRIGSRQAQKVE